MAKRRKSKSKGRQRTPSAPAAATVESIRQEPSPPHRRLKVFSLDPYADVQLERSLISRSVLPVPWEKLEPGPVGEYLEVIDVDPSSGCVYDPVNLNDRDLLAQDGLAPSTGNPQFHQQMVYAVAMKTIANFEGVLGRHVLWAERRRDENGNYIRDDANRYVQRLRIYPHALRDENAYYSPAKGALLFGYFNAATSDPREELPGGLVFTCLSHDIVAHEMTHAILDGMHRRLLDASNADMVAFHEAFADIVAIFQHFTLPGLLLDQIQRTRGDLGSNNLLAELAGQFARATGRGNALRNALGTFDEQGRRDPPDPAALARTFEAHERGAILVAAVFDAFVRMYQNRIADLRRIASGGTGVLPAGDIHPDLAHRFAEEAVRLSQRVLNMCIRALDYLPPVDVTFGDFLRAIVTADADFYPDDPRRYRLAFIEAFRERGIFPLDVRALAEDALRWTRVDDDVWKLIDDILPPPAVLRTMAAAYESPNIAALNHHLAVVGDFDGVRGVIWNELRARNFPAAARRFLTAAWQADPAATKRKEPGHGERYERHMAERTFARFLHGWIYYRSRSSRLRDDDHDQVAWHLGIDLRRLADRDIEKRSRLEVHAVRPTVRLRADGRSKVELLVVLTQRVPVPLLAEPNKPMLSPAGEPLSFMFRGGTTLIVDPERGAATYAVSKNIASSRRLDRHVAFVRAQLAQHGTEAIERLGLTESMRDRQRKLEPFAFVHSRSSNPGAY